MKKSLIFSLTIFLSFIMFPHSSNAKTKPELTPECIEKLEKYKEQFSNLVIQDIIASFQLDIENDGYYEATEKDLHFAHLMYGGKEKDEYYNSLIQQFSVDSIGKPRLYVRPQEFRLLYKQTDNTNVMVLLKPNNSKWEVMGIKKRMGKQIKYKQLECVQKYVKKKKEYYNVN